MLTGEEIDNWECNAPQIGDLVTVEVSSRISAQGTLLAYLPNGKVLINAGGAEVIGTRVAKVNVNH